MSSLFPHFRQRFLHESVWAKETVSQELTAVIGGSQQPLVKMAGRGTALQGGYAQTVGFAVHTEFTSQELLTAHGSLTFSSRHLHSDS